MKVRRALDLKGVAYETLDISPMDRNSVIEASGQALVPVLLDEGRAVADSTRILLHLEERYPDPPLLPRDPAQRAECLLLEDWADAAFMALTRRLAYWHALSVPGSIEDRFFPGATGVSRRVKGAVARRAVRRRFGLSARRNRSDEQEIRRLARIVVDRLGGRPHLVGETISLADVALAAMARPLRVAAPTVREDSGVRALLAWALPVLGEV